MKRTNQAGSIGVFVAVGAILVVASLVVLYTIRQNTLSQNTSPISSDLVATEKKDKKDSQDSSMQQQPNKQGADSKSGGRGEARPGRAQLGRHLRDEQLGGVLAVALAFLITAYYRSRYLV